MLCQCRYPRQKLFPLAAFNNFCRGYLHWHNTGTLAGILFTGADDATADSDVGKNIRGQPGSKKTRLESYYDKLFGPHYTSNKKRAGSTCPEEVEEYFCLPRISTTSNPLEWWARKEKQFPRLAKFPWLV